MAQNSMKHWQVKVRWPFIVEDVEEKAVALSYKTLIFFFLSHCLQLLIPPEAPVDEDVDFDRLSHFEVSGGDIKSAIFRAASRAALRPESERKLKMEDLVTAAEEEVGKASRNNFRRQDSDASRMYN